MQTEVNWINIKISGSDEILDAFSLYWYTFSYNHLRRQNTFPQINIERDTETMELSVDNPEAISLCVFETLIKKFYQLNFKLFAKENGSYNRHVLLYQNGKKIKHFHKYLELININENDHIEIVYRADHVNRKLKLLGKCIKEGNTFYDKAFYIIYENYYADYVEEEKQNDKQCLDNYKIWF